jgi:alpha-1,2-mannosyltransferase
MRLLAVGLAVLFALLNTANAINKGGDADVFFEGGRRLLQKAPLYEGSSAAAGFIGPPFQAVFFAPLAAVGGTAAKLIWHIVNLTCLFAGVWLTWTTWVAVRTRLGLPAQSGASAMLLPVVAVLLPLQTNFEHQNMNTLLLVLLAGATWCLVRGSAAGAGLFIGVAAALKVFPALLILYLAIRRKWTAATTALMTAILLTIVPVFVYGRAAFEDLLRNFWRLAHSGWPVRGNNQSLVAALDRFVYGFGLDGVRSVVEAPLAAALFGVIAFALGALLLALLVTTRPAQTTIPSEVAAVTVLAILLSPIAWDHYWTLLLPAFLILSESRNPALFGRPAQYAFWGAAILTTGLSPLTLGRTGFGVARDASANTIAALVVFGALIMITKRIASGVRISV